MKDIILDSIKKRYYKGSAEKTIDEHQFRQGIVRLSDPIACQVCPQFFATGCDNTVFLIRVQNVVNCINIERFFNQFHNIKGGRCDYLLYDDTKIALIDLSCSIEDYVYPHIQEEKMVQGKRLYARSQIEHTLDILMQEHEIAGCINIKEKKIGIFGYRVKNEESFQYIPRQILKEEAAWLAMEAEIEQRKLLFPMPYGFKFEMVRYDNVYNW